MIIENKPKKATTHYGRVSSNLSNSVRIKSIKTRANTLNPEGRQSLSGTLITYDQLYLQVAHSPIITDNSPQIILVEVTDTGIYKTLLGRFSIKKQVIQPRAVWLDPTQKTISTLARYFPRYDTLEALDYLLMHAVDLLETLPDKKDGVLKPKIPKSARRLYKEYGVIIPSPPRPKEYPKPRDKPSKTVAEISKATIYTPPKYKTSNRVHVPTGDTRSGRF